jgi:hypothetical protein
MSLIEGNGEPFSATGVETESLHKAILGATGTGLARRAETPRLAQVSAESVDASVALCAECRSVWLPVDEERWQAWLTDDEPPELAFYCPPECAEREFT